MRLKWFAQPRLAKTVLSPISYFLGPIFGIILDFLANLHPVFCSRIWAFWVGGFEEIEFHFVKE